MDNLQNHENYIYGYRELKSLNYDTENSAIKLTLEIVDKNNSNALHKNIHSIKSQKLINEIERLLIEFYDKRESKTLLLDPENLQLEFYSHKIKLTYLEFSLMTLFYKAPNRTFTRDQIIALAYHQSRDITDRAIDSHIKNLRKKIRSLGINGIVIESVYGMGYRYQQ